MCSLCRNDDIPLIFEVELDLIDEREIAVIK